MGIIRHMLSLIIQFTIFIVCRAFVYENIIWGFLNQLDLLYYE